MPGTDAQLKRILAEVLPLDRIGPHMRQSVRRALKSDNPARISKTTRLVVGELLRRGDLVRVAIAGSDTGDRSFCLIKGTNQLLDLSIVGLPAIPIRFDHSSRTNIGQAEVAQTEVASEPDFPDLTGMLGAMEQAQDLEVGDPHSGEKEVILASILRLLGEYTPQFDLYIMLNSDSVVPVEQNVVFAADKKELGTTWMGYRAVGQSIWIPDASEFPKHISTLNLGDRQYSSAICVPLWEPAEGSLEAEAPEEAGLFFLATRESWPRENLQKLANRLSRFVTKRWQHQRDVNQKIHTDGLTGVKNRAFFDAQFTLELERARRSSLSLTLIIADLDLFKGINDKYGHQQGDLVLQMVARRLQEELRRIDHICRIGGEEFALILPDTDLVAAQEVILRLLNANFSEEILYQTQNLDLTVTSSFGAVTFPDAGSDAFELYRKADAMLYLSKDLGRNQCHIWSGEGNHTQLKPLD